MFKVELHDIGFEYSKYWHDVKKQLEKEIKANVIIKYDKTYEKVKIMIILKEINYITSFYYPYNLKDLKSKKYNIIEMVKENLQFRVYESIFYIDTNEVG